MWVVGLMGSLPDTVLLERWRDTRVVVLWERQLDCQDMRLGSRFGKVCPVDNQGIRAEFDMDRVDTAGGTAGCMGIVRDMPAADTADTEADRVVRHMAECLVVDLSRGRRLAGRSPSVVRAYRLLKHQGWWHRSALSSAYSSPASWLPVLSSRPTLWLLHLSLELSLLAL